MAEDSDRDDGEKTEEPTQYRIDEFRKRGEVASSRELTNVLVLAASSLTLILSVVFIYEQLEEFMRWVYTLDHEVAFSVKSLKTIATKMTAVSLKCAAPVFLVTLCIGVLCNLAQVGFLYAPEVLEWDINKVNPIKGFQRLLSTKALFEAFKGLLKFAIIIGICYLSVKDEVNSYQGFFHLDFINSFLAGQIIIAKLGFSIFLGMGVIALMDFAYQKYTYKQKLMMTKQEAKQESKEHDGNPEIRQRIRAIQREMSQKRMMNSVPKADVIVTNPTHISVALRYDRENMVSPEVVAKGADAVALRIREIAKDHNIPIVENVPLARTLYKTVKVGHPVPRNLYKAVAEVLAFVYKLKRKQKALQSEVRL
ncbi:MAG: hypothetical protein Fur0010_21060 [Bdellovibrio sp.]